MVLLKLLIFAALTIAVFSDLHVVWAPTAHAQSIPKTTPVINDPLASNCYEYVKSLVPSLPRSSEITANTAPYVGAVVFMDFPHYAVITKLEETGFWVKDSNWGGPGYRTHFIQWDNKHIEGFWSPSNS